MGGVERVQVGHQKEVSKLKVLMWKQDKSMTGTGGKKIGNRRVLLCLARKDIHWSKSHLSYICTPFHCSFCNALQCIMYNIYFRGAAVSGGETSRRRFGRPPLDPEAGPMVGEVMTDYKRKKYKEGQKWKKLSKVRRDAAIKR